MAGDKLTAGNPNITDLSDGFRPTKLGEMYMQLYDDEWTEAFDGLEVQGQCDIEAIGILEKVLMVNT